MRHCLYYVKYFPPMMHQLFLLMLDKEITPRYAHLKTRKLFVDALALFSNGLLPTCNKSFYAFPNILLVHRSHNFKPFSSITIAAIKSCRHDSKIILAVLYFRLSTPLDATVISSILNNTIQVEASVSKSCR